MASGHYSAQRLDTWFWKAYPDVATFSRSNRKPSQDRPIKPERLRGKRAEARCGRKGPTSNLAGSPWRSTSSH